MDALVALLSEGFKESDWTDQEVGVAIGRRMVVIPVVKHFLPYGFLGKYQALQPQEGTTVSEVARLVFNILCNAERTRTKVFSCLVQTLLAAPDASTASEKLDVVEEAPDMPASHLEKLRDGVEESELFKAHSDLRTQANRIFRAAGIPVATAPKLPFGEPEDDLPF